MREAAFNLLTALQRDRPGSVDDPVAWESWLNWLERAYGIAEEPNVVKEGWKSTTDLFSDIIRIRAQVKSNTKVNLVREAASHDAIKRLVSYLRHPDRRVRLAAHDTLVKIQEDHLNPDPELWERWLKDLESGAQNPKAAK